MISVTLNFINIDSAIRGLREVPQNLLVGETVQAKAATVTAAEVLAERDANGGTFAEAKASAIEKKSNVKPEAASTQPTAQADAVPDKKVANSESEPVSIEYPALQKAVFALAAKSRELALSTVAEFGVKTFKELPPEKWADALAAVNAKLAEV